METKPSRSLWMLAVWMLALSVMSYIGRTATEFSAGTTCERDGGLKSFA